jgi:UDP-MurNAc hydroxylase
MKIEMIGHATIAGETQDFKFLMDPVLWDPHQEGLFEVCPKREVIFDKVPDFDILIISHKHLDHFDIRSLAYLPKNIEVFIPKDPIIQRSLRKLGYRNIYPLKDFSTLRIGNTTLMTTRSENRVPEFGMIFADQSGVFWNCVDTIITPATINIVLGSYPKIDFLLATWQPMIESNYQTNQSIAFPYYDYGEFLYNISLINPQAVAPGANAFKYLDGSAWLNQIVFPVTREKFCQDVKQVCPDLKENIFPFDPGDVVEFNRGEFKYIPGGFDYVQKVKDDRESIDFSPVNCGNNLVDDNADNYDIQLMESCLDKTISIDLANFINSHKNSDFKEYYRWQVVYQLEVVFPNPNGSQKWSFDFYQNEIKAQKGRHSLANFFSYITASSLYGLLNKIKGWNYVGVGGYHRYFNKIYHVTPLGLVLPQYISFTDPLAMYFADDNVDLIMRDLEIAKWGQKQEESDANNVSINQKRKLEISMYSSDDLFSIKQPKKLPVF